jgi:drug/metabolite transporter (DMT)-like permease
VDPVEKAQSAVALDRLRRVVRAGLHALRARWRVALSLAAVYGIWGSTYLAVRVGIETLPPLLSAGARYLAAGALLYGALRLRGAPAPTRREWGAAARCGVLFLVFGNGSLFIAQQWVSSGVAAVVASMLPLWAALITAGSAGRAGQAAPSRGEWAGIAVGFAGVALLEIDGQLRAEHAGALLLVLAPVCWALASVWSRSLPLPAGSMSPATQMIAAGPMMLALSALLGERVAGPPSARSLAANAYLTFAGSIAAFSAFSYLLRNTRPAVATSYAYVNPLVAVALGAWLGGERVTAWTWGSMALVVAGLVILSQAAPRAAPERAESGLASG